MKRTGIRSFLCLFCLALAPGYAMADAVDGAAAPDAAADLLAASQYLNELPAFSVAVAMTFDLTGPDGQNESLTLNGTLDFAGEEQARFKVVAPDESMELFVSKDATFLFLKEMNQYMDGAILGSREKALTAIPAGPFRGAQKLLSDYVHMAPDFKRTLDASTVTVATGAPAAGMNTFRVQGDGIATEFQIPGEGNPTVKQFMLDLTELAKQGNADIQRAHVTYTFSDWNVAPEFAADHFTFAIPEGATPFEPPSRQQPAESPLIGKPAPEFTIPLFAGGDLDLAALKKEDKVVILDFWASWCGPCRIGLPILTKVVEKYKDKGVVLYGINAGEDEATVQAFLEQTELDLTVAMDPKRAAQRAYGANSLPTTAIIGKDGVVREVHIGVSPTLEQDLDKLLAELTE